jgi:hypothetical protein
VAEQMAVGARAREAGQPEAAAHEDDLTPFIRTPSSGRLVL